jgi:DNA polymerase family A
MARLLLGNHLSVGLDALARHYGLAAKSVPYESFRGKTWEQLAPDVQRKVAEGAVHDVILTWELFAILRKTFPAEEYPIVDTTVRFYTEPTLRGDIDLLAKVWSDEDQAKKERLDRLEVLGSDLRSAAKFAELLRAAGVEPETKSGKAFAKTGVVSEIYCFAKTDPFMRDLLTHDSERVRALAEGRLGEKSTLLQTRAETLGWMARRGPLPIYLRYAGAHTTRWSGGDGSNFQNQKRGSELRRAICAPEGSLILVTDLSQIEARILCWLAGQQDYLEKFRKGEDPYVAMASKAYGREITKADPLQRGTGKQLVLSCCYQAGAKTIQRTAGLGFYGPAVAIDLVTAEAWKRAYRKEFSEVVKFWWIANTMIPVLANSGERQWGPMLISGKKIYGPGGTMLHYDTLERWVDPDNGDAMFRYRLRDGWTKLYSGKLVENVVSWLARIVLSQAMLRLRGLGYKMVSCSHDELMLVIPDDGKADRYIAEVGKEMSRTPVWAPGLPLASETVVGQRYAK